MRQAGIQRYETLIPEFEGSKSLIAKGSLCCVLNERILAIGKKAGRNSSFSRLAS